MNVLKHVSVGLSIGFVITTFFLVLFSANGNVSWQVLAWCIASAVYGVSSMLFETKALSVLLATILHYLICATVTGINIYLFYREYVGSVLLSFTMIYIVIYIVMWLCEKKQVEKINEKLNK